MFAASKRKWNTDKSLHFIVYYDEASKGFARQVSAKAERYFTSIPQNLGFSRQFWRSGIRVKIYIYNDAKDYSSSTGATWGQGTARAHAKAIFCYYKIKGTSFFDKVLPHELGHIIFKEFMGLSYSAVPLWLHEGVATYQENKKRKASRINKAKKIKRLWIYGH